MKVLCNWLMGLLIAEIIIVFVVTLYVVNHVNNARQELRTTMREMLVKDSLRLVK
jgi:hypothetical protein